MEKLKNKRAAAKLALERVKKGWDAVVEDIADLEWEEVADSYEKYGTKYAEVSKAHVDVMEKAGLEEVTLAAGEGEDWMDIVDGEFRTVRKKFWELKKAEEGKSQKEQVEAERVVVRDRFDMVQASLEKEGEAVKDLLKDGGRTEDMIDLLKDLERGVRELGDELRQMARLSIGKEAETETNERGPRCS